MRTLLLPLLAVASLSACATNRMSDADRLAMYKAHAGEPVKQARYYGSAMGWDRVDDDHVLLSVRPNETWLMTIAGPCLSWGGASPTLGLTTTGPYITPKLDSIVTQGSPVKCRIEEMRPVDTKALRAAEAQSRAQAQASGT